MSVIVSRAIPEIDGFKPAHRKLLYTMYEMGLLKGKRVKSADVVGQTMKLNPHGDAAIYETLIRLTRGNESLLHPFIDSKGNFGKQSSRDMAYAASRYTEVKLDTFCEELFKDIDKDTIDFIDNYTGSMKEPILLPTTFPNILVTPNLGIAVGMASSICSFNLKEVCDATAAYLKDPGADIKKYIAGPDFASGGELIYNEAETESIYKTGRGSFKLRAKYRYDKKNSCIEVYEIPYTTTLEAVIDKIAQLVKTNKVREINDVRDETGLSGLKIAIDIKRNCDPGHLMNKLFKLTTLQDSFNCNFNILIDSKPMTLGIKDILFHWVNFRVKCLERKIAFDIEKKSEKLHLLNGLSKIILDIDRAIKIIRETEEDKNVIPNLIKYFEIDKTQADFIADIKLRNINKEYLMNKINETGELEAEVAHLKFILGNETELKNIISKELKEVSKKFGTQRKTEIIHGEKIEQLSEDDLIIDYPIKIFLTKHNYFKKIPNSSFRFANELNLKDDDYIITEASASNKSDILFFSTLQNVYKIKAYDIPGCKASSLGEYLINMLKLDDGEEILYVAATLGYSGYMVFGFENGKIAKIPLSSYATKINRRKLVNSYSAKSKCIFIDFVDEDKDYLIIRSNDRGLLISSALIPEKELKSSGGVQAFNLKKGSSVTKILRANEFVSDNIEYYRNTKIPSAGHFFTEKDKNSNNLL
ncbi:MAG: topoisomerase IV [Clostridiales bacterium]|nr:topoisomerase IV [Clostridiales bacterium]